MDNEMLYHLSVLPDSDDLSSKSPTCELFKGANVCSHVQSRQFTCEAHIVTCVHPFEWLCVCVLYRVR